MKKIGLFIFLFCFAGMSCRSTQVAKSKKSPSDHYYFKKSRLPENESLGWVMLLPGTGGLTIFKDKAHYFNVAERLTQEGFSVILIDYIKGYRRSNQKKLTSTGNKIVWVIQDAFRWAIQNNYIRNTDKGRIVGWSLAGNGILLLANDAKLHEKLHITSIALYYPANQNAVFLQSSLPVFIQTGAEDNVTELSLIQKYFSSSSNVEIKVYPNAAHGFDVQSLVKGKAIRFPPLFGKKFILQYDEEAEIKSTAHLMKFLKNN